MALLSWKPVQRGSVYWEMLPPEGGKSLRYLPTNEPLKGGFSLLHTPMGIECLAQGHTSP